MRNSVRNLLGLAAAALLMVSAKPAGAINVEVQGTPAVVVAGDNFNVDIVVTGITNEIISAWDIDVAFDGSLLTNYAVTFGSVPLMGAIADTFFGAIFDTDLTDAFVVSISSDADIRALQCLGNVCGPTFTLASFAFQALADGSPTINLVNWGLANDIKCETNIQCYPPVPEPGTLALLSLGLLGLAAGRRKRL